MPNLTEVRTTEGGIFAGKGLLTSPLALFLVQATIILTLSRLIHWALQRLRQPRVIAEIIGGICLGPSLLGNIPHFTETIFPKESLQALSLVSSFGLVMYMFLMGLELDTSILTSGVRRIMFISVAGILLPGVLGAFVSYGLYEFLLEPDQLSATPFSSFILFTLVAMAITAFPVLARILAETKLLHTTVGQMSVSAAAINDICAWVLLALTITIINAGNPFSSLYVLLTITIYAALLLLPGRILLHKLFLRFLYSSGSQILTQLVLAIIFAMIFLSAWTTEWIGVHAIFGAFLIGIIIPRVGGITMELTHKLEDFVGIALLPLYFASSGLKTKMGLLNDWTTALFCVIVIVVACAGKIIGCTLAAKWSGFGWREAISIGVLMNTKGLVELIVLNIGLDAGVINERIFAIMVVMALVTTFMTSPLIAYIYPPKYHHVPGPSTSLLPPKGSTPSCLSMRKRGLFGLGASARHDSAMIRPGMVVSDGDKRILLYLNNMDSIPLVANILLMFRGSMAPEKRLYVNGFKAYSDVDASSNIMVSTQTEFVVEADPALKMLRFFGRLIDAETHSLVAITRLEQLGDEIDRLAVEQHCDTVIIPWQQDAIGSHQRTAVLSVLHSAPATQACQHVTVGVFVDRRVGGLHPLFVSHQQRGGIPAPTGVATAPFTSIIVPITSTKSFNDCAALQMAFQLHRHANAGVHLKVVHVQLRSAANFEHEERELAQAIKSLSKEALVDGNHVPATLHTIKSHQPHSNGAIAEDGGADGVAKEASRLKSELAKLFAMSTGEETRHQRELVILPFSTDIHLTGLGGQPPPRQRRRLHSENGFSKDLEQEMNGARESTTRKTSSTPHEAQKRSPPVFSRRMSERRTRVEAGPVLNEEQQIFGTLGEWLLSSEQAHGPSLLVLHVQHKSCRPAAGGAASSTAAA